MCHPTAVEFRPVKAGDMPACTLPLVLWLSVNLKIPPSIHSAGYQRGPEGANPPVPCLRGARVHALNFICPNCANSNNNKKN